MTSETWLRMAAEIIQRWRTGFQCSQILSIDYLGAGFEGIEIPLTPKGTWESRTQSFDYLGAVSEISGDRVRPSRVSVCHFRNTSGLPNLRKVDLGTRNSGPLRNFDLGTVGLLKSWEFVLESIPPAAGRGPCLALDFASGLPEVPHYSIPWIWPRFERCPSKLILFVSCLSNTVELKDPLKCEEPCNLKGKSGEIKDPAAAQSFVPGISKVSRLPVVLLTVGETTRISVFPQN
jgi:hypothetical protein